MLVYLAMSLFMYNRAKESMNSTPVAAGDEVGPQNDEEEKGVFAVAKMNY